MSRSTSIQSQLQLSASLARQTAGAEAAGNFIAEVVFGAYSLLSGLFARASEAAQRLALGRVAKQA